MSKRTERWCSKWLRVVVGTIVAITCVKVWLGPVNMIPEAQAQIPDAGAQRAELVREMRRTNELLGQVVKCLKTQTLKVQVVGTDKKTEGRPRPVAPGSN
jgi:hypothetical protein